MVRAGCVSVAGIQPSRIRLSGSSESVRWRTCVHGLDLGLHFHPKELQTGESEPTFTPSGGSSQLDGSEESQIRGADAG